MGELAGKTAIVTGGAQGIGFGIALEMARAGSNVVVADRDLPKATAAAEEIGRSVDHGVIARELDVTRLDMVHHCVQASIEHFSQVDILVNNAGIHCERVGHVSTVDDFSRCFDVNLFGIWRMTQALVPHFRARQTGKIINIASINGRRPWADTPAYSASKAALISLTQSLATKLGSDNINVNAICPGGVLTAMADAFNKDRDAMLEEILRSRVFQRALLPEDIGHAAVFLASSRAQNITGQALNVDGGAVMS